MFVGFFMIGYHKQCLTFLLSSTFLQAVTILLADPSFLSNPPRLRSASVMQLITPVGRRHRDNRLAEGVSMLFRIEVKQFRETLLLHMGNVMKSLAERTRHKRQYDRRMNERQMQSRESKVVSSKALDDSLVVTECNGTKSYKNDTSSSLRTYITHVADADIRSVKDKEDAPEFREFFEINDLKAQLQAKTTLICNLKNQIKSVKDASNEAKVKHEIDVLETINIELESSVAKLLAENEKLNKENEHLKQTYKELYDSIKKTRIQTKDHNDSLIAQVNSKTVENADLKAQIQEKVFANVALKNELRKLKGNSVDTKFAKPSILGKPVLQPPRNQSVVRQPNAFKSERPNFSKPRFASQVDVNNVLSKPVTPHYLPKVREYVLAKPHHVIAPGSFRNSQEEPYGSNDMAHNHYLEEARKKTQERNRNSKPSVMHTTSLQNTTNGSKPNPRSNNQISRSLPVSKSSCGMSNGVSLVDHSRNSSSFSDSKHFVCSTCHKCVFNANHDNCITKFLKEVNSRAKVQSPKTRNNTKPVEPKSHTQKPSRQIAIGQRFSPKKSSAVHEKPNTPRSCLRWKPTGRIFKIAGLRWIPTGKMFTDNTTKVDSEPSNGSNDDITNSYECDQTLNFRPRSSTYGSNDMAHNHYLEEARKKTQERNRNSKPSMMHTTSLQNTTNGSKPNPRSNNQISRSLPVSKSSCGMSNGVSLVDHSRNSSSFSDSKHFVCSTCHKCVFNANHDNCITKFLKEVNSRAKVQSPNTRNNTKPVEPKSHTQKPSRQIAIGQRFSPKKSSAMHEKPNTPRSCLRWKLTGRIFKIAGLRWIPTGKMFTDNTTKVDSEPLNGSNDVITNSYECDQTLNVSAAPVHSSSGPNPNLLTPGPISSGLVPNSAPAIAYVPPTNKDLELLFQLMFNEYFETPTGDHQMPYVPAVPTLVIPTGPSIYISFDHDASSGSHSPSSSAHQSSSVHPGVAIEHSFEVNPFTATEHEPFVNVFAPDPNSEASSSGILTINTPNQSTQPHEHLRKWTDSHPLNNIIGNPSCEIPVIDLSSLLRVVDNFYK
ncbi:hypothetical protein Tco_0805914 [Tanacetum coccineum]